MNRLAKLSVGGSARVVSLRRKGTVDSTMLPFAATSVWRLGVASAATYTNGADPRDVAIGNVDSAGQAWINADQFSHPVAYGTTRDPLTTVTDTGHGNATYQEYVPTFARIAAASDADMHVITPDRRYVLEHWAASRVDSTHYNVQRRAQVDLMGSGIDAGVRVYGGSAIGGLIRTWEIDSTHPAYTGVIRHPLALALRSEQLFYDGAGGGYVWPARSQDGNASTAYAGPIPMGSYFAIPPTVDVTTLGLTSQGLMLARAAQNYGAYVVDRSLSTCFYVEDDGGAASLAFAAALRGQSSTAPDLRTIFKALRVVTNNTPSTPNGGPLGAARRA